MRKRIKKKTDNSNKYKHYQDYREADNHHRPIPDNNQVRMDMGISDSLDHKSYILVVTRASLSGIQDTLFAIHQNDIDTPLRVIKREFFTGAPWPRERISVYLLPSKKTDERFCPQTEYLGNNFKHITQNLEARYNDVDSLENQHNQRPRFSGQIFPSSYDT